MKKQITFFYACPSQWSMYQPLVNEAKRRGYKVDLTKNPFKKSEIGVYCEHANFPQYSKFSAIILHDIIQQYGSWPDIWMNEPWNKYDVGFLPNDQWVRNWQESSKWFYTHPKYGVYKAGWPKADDFANIDREKYRDIFCKKYGLDSKKKTVLYAPSWENDHKQDDFVQAMLPLNVNILIKQATAEKETFPEIYKNIMEMYDLHKNNPRVTLLDRKMNIFDAILASDILVSEESSTMAEATMMGIPAISVSNWLIPDTTPSRYPSHNYDFVVMTKKENLTECVAEILQDYNKYKQRVISYRDEISCNIGKASKIIMDVIDDSVSGKKVRYAEIASDKIRRLPLKKYLIHKYKALRREVCQNYRYHYKALDILLQGLKRMRHFVIKE